MTLQKILAFVTILGACFWVISSFQSQQEPKMTGVSLVSPPREIPPDNFQTLRRINPEWVAIIPYAFSRNGEAGVYFDDSRQWWGERTNGTIQLIKYAQDLGYKVMLKPHVWLMSGWIGDYDLDSEEKWKKWEKEYEEYALNYAQVADSMGVELFCIATEIKIATQKRKEYWPKLISKIRDKYNGPLTYAANWDNYQNVSFWNDLDYIGIDAYFPLRSEDHPTHDQMLLAWEPIKSEINSLSHSTGKPVLFTEYGFQSVDRAAGEHWMVDKSAPNLNFQLQADAYECLFHTFWGEPWFAGGFLWKWHLKENAGGLKNPNWTPQNKLAESVIKKWHTQVNQ